MKFRTFLLGTAALFIAVAAAYFSITGLSKLFAGASTAVILMASSLEFGKLVSASFLYAYWEKMNKFLRTYLVLGVIVLILITSAGIYGFLTSAYQVTADEMSIMDKQVEIVELKKGRFEEQLVSTNEDRSRITESINELTKGLSNNVIQYKDSKGDIITTTSSATRNVLERQLEDSKSQRDNLALKIEVLSDSVTKLDIDILNLQRNNEVAGEIGTLKYLAEITGKPMSSIVNWFALFIVFVFDPLAVTLVIAFNSAMKIDDDEKNNSLNSSNPTNYKIYGDVNPIEKEDESVVVEQLNDTSVEEKLQPIELTVNPEFDIDLSSITPDDDDDDYVAPPPNDALKRAAVRYKELKSNTNDPPISKQKSVPTPWGEMYVNKDKGKSNYPDDFDSKTY